MTTLASKTETSPRERPLKSRSCCVSEAARPPARRILLELDARALADIREQDVRIAVDHREQVVEVVRDAPGELAHGLEVPRHRQLGLQLLARGLHRLLLGDVAARGLDDEEPTLGVEGSFADQMKEAAPVVAAGFVLAFDQRRLGSEHPHRSLEGGTGHLGQ